MVNNLLSKIVQVNKLALGTVQFGLKYGIANKIGQIRFEDVKKYYNLQEMLILI